MKSHFLLFLVLISSTALTGWKAGKEPWLIEKHKGYNLSFTSFDKKYNKEYRRFIENGVIATTSFFSKPYKNKFTIYIHPGRHSLDSTWQKDWNMPNFKSECWMVASGIANRIDMISPKSWDKEACEHLYSNTTNTQQLVTHELVHVYHAQLNVSPDFNDVMGIDWFVEGLATYASGQCDSLRIAEVKKSITENRIPANLDKFWVGKIKYGLSGSVVMYIDNTYGRKKLIELLRFNKNSEILSSLNISEAGLISAWKQYIEKI